MQTIFALATARGKSGVAVIRISGPDAFEIGNELAGSVPEPGRFVLRTLRDASGEALDEGLVLSFAAPRSYSGEDTIELQVHGSIAVIRAVEAAIAETGRARLAKPGEFTQRALLNGNLDLSQVEGLSDLIAADTELQRKQAQSLLSGGLREFSEMCRADLLRAAALIEATIDFADEEVPVDVTPDVKTLLAHVHDAVRQQLAGLAVAERLRGGFEVAIIGAPNVGKSTLLNRIAGREIAITSEIAGTTRDVLEAHVDLDGLPVTFLDTAGLRESLDAIEKIGVRRALDRARDADLRIGLTDQADMTAVDWPVTCDLTYRTKADRSGPGISAMTGRGIDSLLEDVSRHLGKRMSEAQLASRDRHQASLSLAERALSSTREILNGGHAEAEIVAVYLRDAINALDALVGRIDVEAVLGEIFSEFCIGK